MSDKLPRSVRVARALLLIMAIFLALNTLARLCIVAESGITDGMLQLLGVALLAVVGTTFLLACAGGFFLIRLRARLNWWLLLCTPLLGFVSIAPAMEVIPV